MSKIKMMQTRATMKVEMALRNIRLQGKTSISFTKVDIAVKHPQNPAGRP
jgi:hypothetical protein